MLKALRKTALFLFYALLVAAPFGTRYIWRMGEIAGTSVEWGAVSVFATQILAGAVIVLSWPLLSGRGGFRPVVRQGPVTAALSLALLTGFSVLWAMDPYGASVAAVWAGLGALIFAAAGILKPDPRHSLIALGSGALIQSVIGIAQFLLQYAHPSKYLGMASHSAGELGVFVVETVAGRWLRAYGTFPHPNMLGIFAAVGILAALALAATSHKKSRLLWYAAIVPVSAAMLFSFSRSAAVGLIAGAAVMLAVYFGRKRASRAVKASFAVSAAAVLLTVFSLSVPFRELVITRAMGEGRLEVKSVEERGSQIQDALDLFYVYPIVGVGVGQMPRMLAEDDRFIREGWEYAPVHNMPLLITVELGILGILLWVSFLLSLFLHFRLSVNEDASVYRTAFLGIFAAVLAAGLFDHYLWSTWTGQLIFWLSAALLWASVFRSGE